MSVNVGLIAGHGMNAANLPVIWRYLRDPYVCKLLIATNPEEVDMEVCRHPKAIIIKWDGENRHDMIARQNNNMLEVMREEKYCARANWYMICEDDGMPCDNYFEVLQRKIYSYPVIATGRCFNLDGSRYWDIARNPDPNVWGKP